MKTKQALKLLIEKQEQEINALKIEFSIKQTNTSIPDTNQDSLFASIDDIVLYLQEHTDLILAEKQGDVIMLVGKVRDTKDILMKIFDDFDIYFSEPIADDWFLKYSKGVLPTRKQLNALIDTAKMLID